MREGIESYVETLEGLSTLELSRSAEKLVGRIRRNEAELIAHLAEISRRRGHLELGYGNLFDYCQQRLGLGDGGAVWRRTQVAGVARRFPQVLEHLARGSVSLSALAILAAHLSEENVDGLLSEADGKTTREVKEIVAGIRPKPEVRPGIRRKPERSGATVEIESSPPPEEARQGQWAPVHEPMREPEKHAGTVEVARPEVYNFRFSAGKAFRQKLERLGEVLGSANAAGSMAEVLEKALDLALEKKDPRRKLERRRRRQEVKARGEAVSPPESSVPAPPPPEEVTPAKRTRYIPSSVRERVFERAAYRCEFIGADGVRCTARTRLEVDHVQPFEKGGGRGEENLRVLCRGHNLLAAEREFGAAFMRRRIEDGSGKQRLVGLKDTG